MALIVWKHRGLPKEVRESSINTFNTFARIFMLFIVTEFTLYILLFRLQLAKPLLNRLTDNYTLVQVY